MGVLFLLYALLGNVCRNNFHTWQQTRMPTLLRGSDCSSIRGKMSVVNTRVWGITVPSYMIHTVSYTLTYWDNLITLIPACWGNIGVFNDITFIPEINHETMLELFYACFSVLLFLALLPIRLKSIDDVWATTSASASPTAPLSPLQEIIIVCLQFIEYPILVRIGCKPPVTTSLRDTCK